MRTTTKVGVGVALLGLLVLATGEALNRYQRVDGANIGAGLLILLSLFILAAGPVIVLVGLFFNQ